MLHTDTMSPQKVLQKSGYLKNLPYFCSKFTNGKDGMA